MLIRLLREFLRRYRRELALVVIFQTIQTMAALLLPRLNAELIDNGVLLGDTDYIWHQSVVMLSVTFVQVVCSVVAVYYGSRAAMGFGRERGGGRHDVLRQRRGEADGKAGAYAVQENGDKFVEKIDGSFLNVVGFPLELFERELPALLKK